MIMQLMIVIVQLLVLLPMQLTIAILINHDSNTPSLPTKSLGFRGFDSSKLLIIRGGNSHVRIILCGVSRKV